MSAAVPKTGDTVLHKPTGEEWIVAYCENGRVCCCGWPETVVPVEECELITVATPHQESMLLVEMKRGGDSRGEYARRRLAVTV